MGVLRLGLIVAALAFVYVTWASWAAGYYPEIAMFRGLLAFMAVSFIGYLGELVVATTPQAEQAEGEEDGEREFEDEAEETPAGAQTVGANLAGETARANEPVQAQPANIVSLDDARAAREQAREQQGQGLA